MTPLVQDLLRIAPEIVLTVFCCLIILADPFLPKRSKDLLGHIAFIGMLLSLAAFLVAMKVQAESALAFHGLLSVDVLSLFGRLLILLIAGLTLISSYSYLDREGRHQGEYYSLILLATIGMNLMVMANELVMFFLALETSSIATYVLVGFRRKDRRSNEASIKYFLLGSFATAILLYGVALLYGATGSTFLPEIAKQLTGRDAGVMLPIQLVYMGMALIFVGLCFKVAAAPFQVWTPDVYEGAPTPVTAFLAVGAKAAAVIAFLRIFLTALGSASEVWTWALWGSAIATMLIGNLGALAQKNVKRMLAYSSIAHAGYILIAFAAAPRLGVAAVLFYLVAYTLMKLGAFAVVAQVSNENSGGTVAEFAGLHANQPGLALAMTVFLLSLIGIPLTGGFLGKLYLFRAGLDSGLLGLVILAALNSVLSAGYYLKVVKAMYMDEPGAESSVRPVPASLSFVLTVTALGTILLGILPGPVLAFAEFAANTLAR